LALIRTRLPLIVDRLTAAYPQTRKRLDRLRIETAGGKALRAWLLDAYRLQLRALVQLRREVTTGGYAWAAVLRWSEVNHQETAGFSTRLSSILRALPATQQLGIERAITTYLG
jgi:hypothetical protein